MITYIETQYLSPHPDNPRKDLGDLSELADSIKSNGIMQNLTVVPWIGEVTGEPLENRYKIVIGHRRHAAAKLAGLMELPCVISDMDLKTQISTMLLENMQRADLTVYEQAQGFQMMLNLGDTVNDISEKTGFSETTVRRRVKLLELDSDKFRASTERGATLQDYMELDKIESVDRKNAVLDKIGTSNFQYELRRAIDDEQREKNIAEWEKVLSAFATQVNDTTGYRQVRYLYVSDKPEIERPEDADNREYFFHINKYGSIYLLVKDDGQAVPEDPAAARRRERLEYRRSCLEEATVRAYDLRKAFILGISAARAKKLLADIVAYSVFIRLDDYSDLDDEFLGFMGVETVEDDVALETVTAAVSKSPERALLLAAYCDSDDGKSNGYHSRWNAEYAENESLDCLYDFLEKLGYQMSDEEKALRDGTHELYIREDTNDSDDE